MCKTENGEIEQPNYFEEYLVELKLRGLKVIDGFFVQMKYGKHAITNNMFARIKGMPYRGSLIKSPVVKEMDKLCDQGLIDNLRLVQIWNEQRPQDGNKYHEMPFVQDQLKKMFCLLRERGFSGHMIVWLREKDDS